MGTQPGEQQAAVPAAEILRAVKDGYSLPREVARYRERAGRGLLTWQEQVVRRYLVRSGRLLDIGCGGGREALALAARGHSVVAVDISPEQVASARAAAAAADRDITFAVCDGTTLDFADGSFAYVTLWAQVLGNVPGRENRVGSLRECARVLEPSGLLSFSVHNREVCEPTAREQCLVLAEGPEEGDLTEREPATPGLTRYWHYFRREEICALCAEAGLRVTECCLASDLGQSGWDTVWVCVGGKG